MTSFLATPPVTADVGSDAELACSILLQKKAQVAQARGNIRNRIACRSNSPLSETQKSTVARPIWTHSSRHDLGYFR